jgi:hypothetical protein
MCGVRFGFGNRIVSFNNKSRLITVNHKPVQPTIAQRVAAFDHALETMDLTQVLDQKIAEAQNDVDK